MEYWKVFWHHDFTEEPEVLWSEIGADGYETRKVQRFKDGRLIRDDGQHETRDIGLSEVPVGKLEDVAEQAEFSAFYITREEFESEWRQAVWSIPHNKSH